MNQGDGFSPVVGVAVFLGVFAPRAEALWIQSIDLHEELRERERAREGQKERDKVENVACCMFTVYRQNRQTVSAAVRVSASTRLQ